MPEVSITLRTIDESSKKVEKVKEEYEGISPALEKAGRNIAGFVSKNATLIAAVVGVGLALKGAYQEYQKYAGEVRDVMEISGLAAKESSKLIQLLDDFEVSTSTLQTAVRAMTKQGLVPTVDTVAKLSDEFKGLETQQEKNEFLFKNFGRSGIEWVNVLSRGSDEIHKLNEEALKSLILSDQQIADAEEQRLAIDALADAWQGLKVQTGAFVGGQITAFKRNKEYTDAFVKLHPEITKAAISTGYYSDDIIALGSKLERGEAMTAFYTNGLENQSRVIEGVVIPTEEERLKIIEELTKVNQEYLSMVGSLTGELKDFAETEQDLVKEQGKLLAEKKKLIAQGWSKEGAAIKDVDAKLAENAKAQTKNAEATQLAGRTRVLSMLEQELAVDGLSEAETQFLEDTGLKWGVYSADAVRAARVARSEVDALVDSFNNIPEYKSTTLDVFVNAYLTGTQAAVTASGSANYVQQLGVTGRAGGGKLSSGWTLVGDLPGGNLTPYSELISPDGTVYDAKTTRDLYNRGLMSGIQVTSRASDLFGSGLDIKQKPSGTSSSGGSGTKKINPGGTSGAVFQSTGGSAVAIAPILETQASVEMVQKQVMQMQQQLQQQLQNNSEQNLNKLDEVIAVLLSGNPREIGKQVGFEFARAS